MYRRENFIKETKYETGCWFGTAFSGDPLKITWTGLTS